MRHRLLSWLVVAELLGGLSNVRAQDVEVAPSFVQQPQGCTRYPGDGVLFSSLATGSPAPTYQWFQNGNLLTDATNSQLFLSNVALSDAGDYTVVASSGATSVTSTTATLVVLADTDVTGTIQDVRHVVVFMQENRAFDEYFGALKGVQGFGDRNALIMRNGTNVLFQPSGSNYVLPFHFSYQCLEDVDHGWYDGHYQWDSGKWDAWIPQKGTEAMPYLTRDDLAYYYSLAESYTICDAYFCSVMGPTFPNRLYLMTGMIDPQDTGGGPVIDNHVPQAGYSWTTYPERLQAAGVSWKVYQQSSDFYPLNALGWFAQYKNAPPGNPLHDRGMVLVNNLITAFSNDVANGTLPRVSWIIPPWSQSEHPVYSPANGERLTKQLLDALASNPTVYNSTVFILNYDEAGGYFDHVVPAVPPSGTPDEFVGGWPIGLGVRAPALMISPWSRGGYVCSQVFDHTSVLQFLEAWTGVQETNISAWRRKVCGDLTSAFNFTAPNTNYPSLPTTAPINCSFGIEPTVPSPQTVPVQEDGRSALRPLPYQPNATSSTDCGAGRFWIAMTNSGSEAVHFAIYANIFSPSIPRQYDVDAAAATSDNFNIHPSGKYDFTCYGPTGFQRRFAGNISSNCNQVEVTSTIDPGAGAIALAMQNFTPALVTFTVTNGYPTGGPWTYDVPAGSIVTDTFPVVANNDGWYDLTVTASSDALFLRRLLGHMQASDFSLAVTPSANTVCGGSNATYTVSVGLINGFATDVALSVTGLPDGVSASFNPPFVNASGTALLTLTTPSNTLPTNFPLTVMGTTSNLTRNVVVTLTINPLDTDGDGISDWWTQQYFGSIVTDNFSCATCDVDGTGQNNFFKYIAGLDPTNATSVFSLNITDGPTLMFSPITAGRSYVVLFSTNLASGIWLPLAAATGPTTNGNQITIADTTATESNKFYRVQISWP